MCGVSVRFLKASAWTLSSFLMLFLLSSALAQTVALEDNMGLITVL